MDRSSEQYRLTVCKIRDPPMVTSDSPAMVICAEQRLNIVVEGKGVGGTVGTAVGYNDGNGVGYTDGKALGTGVEAVVGLTDGDGVGLSVIVTADIIRTRSSAWTFSYPFTVASAIKSCTSFTFEEASSIAAPLLV